MADRRTEARAVVLAVLMLVSMVGVGFTGSGAGTYASVSPDSMTENEHPFTTQDTESTIVVDGNGGGDYTTIQSGVDNATDGDTVEVRPGTYSEQVVLEKNITLVAPDGATIEGPKSDTIGTAGIQIAPDSIAGPISPVIHGFTIEGYDHGVFVGGSGDGFVGDYSEKASGNWTLRNVTIRDSGAEGIETAEGVGDWRITGTEIHNTTYEGIYADGATGEWIIEETVVTQTGRDGILARNTASEWVIQNTTIENSSTGIEAGFNSADWIVRNTTIKNNSGGITAADTSGDWLITGSHIRNNTETGISLNLGDQGVDSASGNWTVTESHIVNNGAEGINARDATKGDATRNYWGAPDGPSGDFNGSGDAAVGNLTVVPYYTNSELDSLSSPVTGTLTTTTSASLEGDFIGLLRQVDDDVEVYNGTVGEDGSFEVTGASTDAEYNLGFADLGSNASSNGVPDLYAIQNVTPPQDVGEVTLPEAHNVTVRVTDEDGDPIEGADVLISHNSGNATIKGGERNATNETGYLDDSLELVGEVSVSAEHRGTNDTKTVTIDDDREITVQLDFADVTGSVTAESGASVVGDTVGLFRQTDEGNIEGTDTTVGENGDFSLSGANGTEYTLAFGDDEFGTTSNGVPDLYAIDRVTPPEDVGEVAIPQAHNVTIRVTDEDGDPIEGADVVIAHVNGSAVVEEGARNATNESGYFTDTDESSIELVGEVGVFAEYRGVNATKNVTVNDDRDITVELARPEVTGTLDAESGASVENDSVILYRETGDGIERYNATVDADGNFSVLAGSADETYNLAFVDADEPVAPNGVPDLYAIDTVTPPEDIGSVSLPAASNVSIRVIDQNGEGIEGADVGVTHQNNGAIVGERADDVTNEAGYLSLDGDTEFELTGNLTVRARSTDSENLTNVTVNGDQEIVVKLDLTVVNGTVTDARGDPVENGSVRYTNFEDGEFEDREVITDESGNYEVGLSPGEYRVLFKQEIGDSPIDGVPDIYAAPEEVFVEGETQNDIELPEAHRLQVRVVNESGAPLSNEEVDLVQSRDGSAVGVGGEMNETGYVYIDGTSGIEINGTVDVTVESDRYYGEQEIDVTKNKTVVVEANELVTYTGNVTNATGAAISEGEVFAQPSGDVPYAESSISEDGEFELALAENATYEVGFRQDGAETTSDFPEDGIPDIQSLTKIETGTRDVRLPTQQLGVGHPFEVTVVGPGGNPVSDANVYVSDNNNEEDFALGVGSETNADGALVLYGADDPGVEVNGSIDVYVIAPEGSGLASASRRDIVVDEPRETTVQLRTEASVNGTILRPDGEPAAFGTVDVSPAVEGIEGDRVATNETGFFDARVAADGAYRVGFVQDDAEGQFGPPYPQDGVPDVYAIANVTNAEEAALGEVTLPEPHNLTVNVVGPNDEPVSDATIRLWSTANDAYQWGGETTVSDGSLTVEVNGSVDIQGSAPDGTDLRSEDKQIEVTEDETVNITLDRSVSVFGSVEYADGSDAAGYTMTLPEAFGESSNFAITDESGFFEFSPKPNRLYVLGFKQDNIEEPTAGFPKDGRPDLHTFGGVDVGETDVNLDNQTLPQGHLVNVTVETTSGDPVSGADVEIDSLENSFWVSQPATTREDGEVILSGASSPGIEANGTLRVDVLESDDYAQNTTEFEIDGDRDVTVVVRDRVNVTGQLKNKNGENLTDYYVFASNGAGYIINQTDDTGKFAVTVGENQSYSITALQAGNNTVAPRDNLTDLYHLNTTEVGTDDTNIGEQTIPNANGILNISVTNESNEPVGSAIVSVRPVQAATDRPNSERIISPTNAQGYHTLYAQPGFEAAGSYMIRVGPYPGDDRFVDETKTRTVNVTDDETVTVELTEADGDDGGGGGGGDDNDGGDGSDDGPDDGEPSEPTVTAAIAANQTDVYPGEAISFNASASEGTDLTYEWTFDDNTSATVETVEHAYDATGTYNVTLTVTNQSASDTDRIAVSVVEPIEAEITPAGRISRDVGESVQFNGSESAGNRTDENLTYEWTFGDGTTADGEVVTHEYDTADTYTVTLTVTDAVTGETTTDTVEVEVSGSTEEGTPGFGPLAALIALVSAALAARVRN